MFQPQKRPKTEVKKAILAFLDRTAGGVDTKTGRYRCGMIHHTGLVLATSANDKPRATPLEFFHEGLTLYVFGEPGGKIANIKRNPVVSAAVYEQPMLHSRQQQSLQIFGTADLITMRSNPRLFRAKSKKWNLPSVIETFAQAATKGTRPTQDAMQALQDRLFNALTLIRITPDHIILREYNTDFTMPKYEWRK